MGAPHSAPRDSAHCALLPQPPHLPTSGLGGARGGAGGPSPAVPPLALTYLHRGARRKGGGQGTAGLDARSPGAGQQQFPELPLTRVPGLRWHLATRPRTRGWPCTRRQSPGFAVALGQEGPLPPCPTSASGPPQEWSQARPKGKGAGRARSRTDQDSTTGDTRGCVARQGSRTQRRHAEGRALVPNAGSTSPR